MVHPDIRVLVVDDSADVTGLYSTLINAAPGLACVGALASADDLECEVARLRPDVVLLDLTMPGRDPLEAVAQLAARSPQARVIAFTGYDDDDTVNRVVDAGTWGLISKNEEPPAVVDVIRKVARGEAVARRAR